MTVEPHEQMKNGNAMKFFRDYWFILSTIIGGIVTGSYLWAITEARIKANEIVNEKQEVEIAALRSDLQVLDKSYTQDTSIIKTKVDQIIKQLEKAF